jgi:hypothetical protein
MLIRIPSRWRQVLAWSLAALPVGGTVGAAEPLPVPPPTAAEVQAPPARTSRDVIILHGTTKVYPVYKPKPTPVQPAEAKPWPDAPPYVPPPPSIQEESRSQAAPPTEIVVKIEDRPPQPAPQIVLAGYAMPLPQSGPLAGSTPWLTPTPPLTPPAALPVTVNVPPPAPPTPPPAPQQPTVVVIREPGEAREPAPVVVEQPHGVVLGTEALMGIGVGVLGVGFGLMGWLRRSATANAAATNAATLAAALRHPTPPAHAPEDGLLLMGKYNAGPRRENVERFELGLSYQSEQEEKKKAEAANQQAVLEFILSQNVALHTDLFGPADAALPEAKEINE